jgi:hypothetical protein
MPNNKQFCNIIFFDSLLQIIYNHTYDKQNVKNYYSAIVINIKLSF